jgi:ADP-heptose:LPS heptosyltransferase
MFGSMIGDFSKLCGEIVIQTDERLVPLFRRSFPTNVTVVSSSRAINAAMIDAQVSIGSLGMHVRQSTQEFFEKNNGYLIANSEQTRYFFDQLTAGSKKPLVGVSWKSTNPDSAAKRNIDLRQLCAAVRKALPEARLVSLQYGLVEAEIGGVFDEGACKLLRCPDLDLTRDLDGVAALISACDVVLTIGNTTAHLAGALGKKAIVLLPFAPSWRWMVDGDVTPWYETLKLHRKAAPDSAWSDVIEMAMRSLVSCISRSGTRSI